MLPSLRQGCAFATRSACHTTQWHGWRVAPLSCLQVRALGSHQATSQVSNDASLTTPPTIVSGIQPTGTPHLGNLLGALLPWVQLQNAAPPTTKLLFSIVDLHSLTSSIPASVRLSNRRNLLAAFLAAGLDPERCTIFYQSAVPQHAELHWILSCTSSMAALARMTQWKTKLAEGNQDLDAIRLSNGQLQDDKAVQDADLALLTQAPNPRNVERLKLGLFSYPVLQAADILVHRASHVPVGEDQRQHVEFAKACAAVFNHHYGSSSQRCPSDAFASASDSENDSDTTSPSNSCTTAPASIKDVEILLPPEVTISPAKRIMSLAAPTTKMSKSSPLLRGTILLTDSDDAIERKVRRALTDSVEGISYDRVARPGVSNLLDIIAHTEGLEVEKVVAEMKGENLGGLKMRAARAVRGLVGPIRERFEGLLGEGGGRLDGIVEDGAERARGSAEATMKRVRDAVGI